MCVYYDLLHYPPCFQTQIGWTHLSHSKLSFQADLLYAMKEERIRFDLPFEKGTQESKGRDNCSLCPFMCTLASQVSQGETFTSQNFKCEKKTLQL